MALPGRIVVCSYGKERLVGIVFLSVCAFTPIAIAVPANKRALSKTTSIGPANSPQVTFEQTLLPCYRC